MHGAMCEVRVAEGFFERQSATSFDQRPVACCRVHLVSAVD